MTIHKSRPRTQSAIPARRGKGKPLPAGISQPRKQLDTRKPLPTWVIIRQSPDGNYDPIWAGEARDIVDAQLRTRRGGHKLHPTRDLTRVLADLTPTMRHAYNQWATRVWLSPIGVPSWMHKQMKAMADAEGLSLIQWRVQAYAKVLEDWARPDNSGE